MLDPAPQTVLGGVAAQLRFDAAHYGVWRITFLAHCKATDLAEALLTPLAPTEEARRALLEKRELQASVASEVDDGSASSSSAAPAAERVLSAAQAAAAADMAAGLAAGESTAGAKKAPSKKEAAAQQALLHAHEAALALRVKRSRKAYALLFVALGLEQRQYVQHVPRGDAYGVWSLLEARYDRKTTAS
jgi:hypothetical protein